MTKKKSLLTFVFAICLMIPAMFMLTACGHNHKATTEWQNDVTYHWHACEEKNCKEQLDKAEHTYDNDADTTCNVCGYERPEHDHTATAWKNDSTYHWHDCTVSGCGEQFDKAEHTWGEWEEKTPASDGVNKVEKRICSVCKYEETKTIENSRLDFYMIIEDVEKLSGRGYLAKGTIQRGTVSVNNEIELSGCEGTLMVKDMAKDGKKSTTATHGDYVEILVSAATVPSKGQFLFKAGTMESSTSFKASVTNKTSTSYPAGSQSLDLYVHGINVGSASVVFDEQLDAGNNAIVSLEFTTELPLYEGLNISLKAGGVEILTGTITK